jgi:hypothetical protein
MKKMRDTWMVFNESGSGRKYTKMETWGELGRGCLRWKLAQMLKSVMCG